MHRRHKPRLPGCGACLASTRLHNLYPLHYSNRASPATMPSQKEDIGLDFEFDNAAGWERRDGNNTRPPVRPSVSQQDRSQASDTGRNPTSTAPALQTRTASADAVRYPYGKPRSPRNRPSHYGKKRVSETSREGSVNYSHFRIPNLVRNPEEEEYENPQEPDSFQRDNEADRAEREGAPPHCMFCKPLVDIG